MDSESLTSNQNNENQSSPSEFDDITARLDELVSLVSDDTLSLDKALDYYEEAVRLGMQASTLLEEGVFVQDTEEQPSDSSQVASQYQDAVD